MNTSLPYGLNSEVIEKLRSVFKKHLHIDQVKIYGSRAKGNYRPGSDIDLVIFSLKVDTTELLQIENEIEELLLPYKVDLSIFQKIDNQDLVDHIQRVGIVFYSRI